MDALCGGVQRGSGVGCQEGSHAPARSGTDTVGMNMVNRVNYFLTDSHLPHYDRVGGGDSRGYISCRKRCWRREGSGRRRRRWRRSRPTLGSNECKCLCSTCTHPVKCKMEHWMD